MIRRALVTLFLLGLLGAGAGLWITRPETIPAGDLAGLTGDATRGEAVFHAAGCASCHAVPGSKGSDKLVLAGGQSFPSDFGVFLAPNISSDPTHGIGAWSLAEFAAAVTRGTSPEGQHYYPAFPYTAYAMMEMRDVADLWAFMQGLPMSDTPSQPHQIGFPFNIRASVGGWKFLFFKPGWVMQDATDEQVMRGRYLVEALGHCAECHTPRGALGQLDRAAWMTGAPNPSGRGTIPALTPDRLTWSAGDIAYYLESGFTPDYDSAGGHMVSVIENFAQLTASDREAVAAYLKAVPGSSP